MFWLNKNKNKRTDKRNKPQEGLDGIGDNRVKETSKSQRIREEALANARAARERVGEETIQKIAEAMTKKQNSPMEQAKAKITAADSHLVADEILAMLDDD